MSNPNTTSEKPLSAQNTFTDWITLEGDFMFEIEGAFVGEVTVQRRPYDAGTTADVTEDDAGTAKAFTGPGQWPGFEPSKKGAQYRAGFKTGNYTSGTPTLRLTQ